MKVFNPLSFAHCISFSSASVAITASQGNLPELDKRLQQYLTTPVPPDHSPSRPCSTTHQLGKINEWLHGVRVGFVPSRVPVSWRWWRHASSSVEALRRFSSGDLQSECDEGEVDPYTGRPATTSQPKPQNQRPASQATGGSMGSASGPPPAPSSAAAAGGDLSLNLRGGSRGSVTSVASVGRGYNRDRCVTLLAIDDQNTDWSKYFRGRRLPGEWDIRVEQAEFRELTVTANSDGANVSMAVYRGGTKVTRCFKIGLGYLVTYYNFSDALEEKTSLSSSKLTTIIIPIW
ncbi:unnamed protein product [Diatraea saccharalis]|uniref:Synapsin pre-ATP-grasp domain-containing protein n=1 Tax=Diatraea saccharalis TaxID=40085 RepID=A0A9N9QX78_9NEOP|nr:unnamed protein product [Diatraea saccharalis]